MSLQKGPKNTSHKLNRLKTLFYLIQPFQKVWVESQPRMPSQFSFQYDSIRMAIRN